MTKGKKVGDRAELLTKEEMDRLINVVAGSLFFTTLYKVFRYSGRRTGEIVGTYRNKKLIGGIKIRDIDFENNTMKTIILKTKKRRLQLECSNCKEKSSYKFKYCPYCQTQLPQFDVSKLKYEEPIEITITMRPELPSIIKSYIDNHKPKLKENDYLFRDYSLVYIKKKIKEHTKQASINKNFSIHGFRHYFITQCKRSGMSNEDISKWTGHVRPDTLNTYNRLVAKDVEDKINKVDL